MIKVQLLTSTAKPPIKVDPAAVGWDVFADSVRCDGGKLIYGTGIAITPPEGWYFDLAPRSSQSKVECVLCNSFGVIEPEYTGQVMLHYRPVGYYYNHNFVVAIEDDEVLCGFSQDQELPFNIGDRIGQLILRRLEGKDEEIQIVDKLNETARGSGGFGSTGK